MIKVYQKRKIIATDYGLLDEETISDFVYDNCGDKFKSLSEEFIDMNETDIIIEFYEMGLDLTLDEEDGKIFILDLQNFRDNLPT